MATRLYQPKSVLEQIPDSLHFAWSDPEQRFEWNTMTRRRVFRNLCNIPVTMGEWHLRNEKKPLWPKFSYAAGEARPTSPLAYMQSNVFSGLMLKNALDAGLKFGLASFVKTSTLGYRQHEHWQRLIACSDELLALSHTARLSDPSAAAQASLYQAAGDSPIRRLYQTSQEAGAVMARFVAGDLPLTHGNVSMLQNTLESMAVLCEQKAGLPASLQHESAALAPSPQMKQQMDEVRRDIHSDAGAITLAHAPQALMPRLYEAHGKPRPSDHIRAVITAPKLQSPAQAELYLATLSSLVTDGAFELETEEYRTKNPASLNASESLHIARIVEQALNRHQVQLNRDAQGNALRPDLPTDVMVKLQGTLAVPLSAHEVLALASEVKSQLKFLKPRLEHMLAYADLHYADIDGLLGKGGLHLDRAKANPLRPARSTEMPAAALVAPRHVSAAPDSYYKPQSAGLEYILRDQSRHEMWKLYGRSLPTYLWQVPINLVQRMILKEGQKFWENARLVGYQAAVYPINESFAGVASFEATRLATHHAVNASRRMDEFLAGAVQTARLADPAFRETWDQVHHSPAMQDLMDRYAAVLNKPEAARSGDDDKALAQFFHEMAQQSKDLFQKAYALVSNGKHDFDGFKNHTLRVLQQGARTTPDALKVLSLVRFIREIADEQVLSLEYVDPKDMVVDRAHLEAVSQHALALAQAHGFAISGQSMVRNGAVQQIRSREGGEEAGSLLVSEKDGGFRLASKEELIAYANELAAFLRSKDGVDIPRLFDITVGKMSDGYMHRLESELMQGTALPAPMSPATALPVREAGTDRVAALHPLKHRPHQLAPVKGILEHLFRPEAVHEMGKLRDRQFFVSLFGFPVNLVENLLSEEGFESLKKAFFGKSSVGGALFKAVASTLSTSYGSVAARELALLPHQRLLAHSQEASEVLRATMTQAGRLAPDMQHRFIRETGLHPLLGREAVTAELKNMADILAVPSDKRSAEQVAFLQQATTRMGAELVDGTLHALTGSHASALPKEHATVREQLQAMLSQPATDIPQAAMLIAAVDALIRVESQAIGVLRYEGVAQRMIGNKPLDQLVNYVADRAYTEGMGRMASSVPSASQLIVFANDIAQHARDIVQAHVRDVGAPVSRVLAETLRREQQRSVTQSL